MDEKKAVKTFKKGCKSKKQNRNQNGSKLCLSWDVEDVQVSYARSLQYVTLRFFIMCACRLADTESSLRMYRMSLRVSSDVCAVLFITMCVMMSDINYNQAYLFELWCLLKVCRMRVSHLCLMVLRSTMVSLGRLWMIIRSICAPIKIISLLTKWYYYCSASPICLKVADRLHLGVFFNELKCVGCCFVVGNKNGCITFDNACILCGMKRLSPSFINTSGLFKDFACFCRDNLINPESNVLKISENKGLGMFERNVITCRSKRCSERLQKMYNKLNPLHGTTCKDCMLHKSCNCSLCDQHLSINNATDCFRFTNKNSCNVNNNMRSIFEAESMVSITRRSKTGKDGKQEVFEDYMFVSLAGRGSYGKVYKAYDMRSHEWAAVKEVPVKYPNMAHLLNELSVYSIRHPYLLSYEPLGVFSRPMQISNMVVEPLCERCDIGKSKCKCRKRSISLCNIPTEVRYGVNYYDDEVDEDRKERNDSCIEFYNCKDDYCTNMSCAFEATDYTFDAQSLLKPSTRNLSSIKNDDIAKPEDYIKDIKDIIADIRGECAESFDSNNNDGEGHKTNYPSKDQNVEDDEMHKKKDYVSFSPQTGKVYMYAKTEYCDFSLRDYIDFRNDYYFKETTTKKQRKIKYTGVAQNTVYIPYRFYKKSITIVKTVNRSFCLTILRCILIGLLHLHNLGFSHNDLKCSNVMVHGDSFIPKIGDFGMTKRCKCKDSDIDSTYPYSYHRYKDARISSRDPDRNLDYRTIFKDQDDTSEGMVHPEIPDFPTYQIHHHESNVCEHPDINKARDIQNAIVIYYELLNIFRTQSEARAFVRNLRTTKRVPEEFRKKFPEESSIIEYVMGSDRITIPEVLRSIGRVMEN